MHIRLPFIRGIWLLRPSREAEAKALAAAPRPAVGPAGRLWPRSRRLTTSSATPEKPKADQSAPKRKALYHAIDVGNRPCGAQAPGFVACTAFARYAAELLIDHNDRFDPSNVGRLLRVLRDAKALPPEYKEHVVRTLFQMQEDKKLAATVNSVCERGPLKGPAADMVRATLNLPHDAQPGPAEARRAVLMSLLGYLRQMEVGSCFATAPAICLLHESPAAVARDLKELLEENKLVFQERPGAVEMPLNRRISHATADVLHQVTLDGTCFGINGRRNLPFKLHETPGMHAALTALGIPADQMERAVSTAVRNCIGADPPADQPQYVSVSARQVIEQVVRAYRLPPQAMIAAGLDAFAGQGDVRLLRAWEYTLATAGRNKRRFVDKISDAVLFGGPIAGRPDLASLQEKSVQFQRRLASDIGMPEARMHALGDELLEEVRKVMASRLAPHFAPGLKHKMFPGSGGYTLYDRFNAGPARCVDNEDGFREAMISMVQEAAEKRSRKHRRRSCEALSRIVDNLVDHIRRPEFFQGAAHRMNRGHPDSGGPRNLLVEDLDLPWRPDAGGNEGALIRNYGGMEEHTDYGDKKADATDLLRFICSGLSGMRRELRQKAAQTRYGFRVIASMGGHTFAILPMQIKEVWSKGSSITAEQWMDARLKAPAMRYLQQQRVYPPLLQVLEKVGFEVGAGPDGIERMYSSFSGNGAYTLEAVHRELRAYCDRFPGEQGKKLRARGEELLRREVHCPPAVVIADTNWARRTGEAQYLAVRHDPYSDTMEVLITDRNGRFATELSAWNPGSGSMVMYAPLSPAA